MGRPKKVMNPEKYERLTIRLTPEVKEWYVSVADTYGMAYSALMQMVLTNYMTQTQNAEAVRELTRLGGSELNEQSVKVLAELVEVLKEKE
ncbi:MAG: hypothetical protein IIT39_10365 [Clostridia bacterium]|nr:hypothetical protein [Clostridia bacterium]